MWIFGHRGASWQAPENTLAAFELAMQQQASGVEFDTYQHTEAILVFHDRWLSRTTNGQGKLLETPLSELRQLDAGQGQQIPVLSEALGCLPAHALCNIEIKHLYDARLWAYQLEAAMTYSALSWDNVIISAFNHRWLRQIKQYCPEVRIGALVASYPEDDLHFAQHLAAFSVHVSLDVVDEHFVQMAHRLGHKVLVFTVDYPQDMQMLADWGVDGIFTNVPELARQTLITG